MTLKSSAKVYLTIFLMTMCVYMVLYQYHLSGAQILQQQQQDAINEIKVVDKSKNQVNNKDYSQLNVNKRRISIENSQKQEQQQQPEQFLHNKLQVQQPNDLKVAQAIIEYIDQSSSIDNTVVVATSSSSSTTKSSSLSSSSAAKTTTSATSIKTTLPPLYIITPTYKRPEQLAELTRLGYTLKHISNLLWLVIEDAETPSKLVTDKLHHIGVPFLHLIAPMPQEYRKSKSMPRGVSNRNRGLEWLRANATDGVFYFADDDNTYDISIFEQMRYIKKVAMWPVGLVTKLGVSSPIVRDGKMIGFYDGWIGGRKYPVDMAGFAVSVKFLLERPKAKMPFKAGYEEDGFLKSLHPFHNSEIELLASDCTELLTWHTQTKKNGVATKLNMTRYGNTNLVTLSSSLVGSNK